MQNMPHLDLTGLVGFDNRVTQGLGGFCDVFIGKLQNVQYLQDTKLAIKRIRVHMKHSTTSLSKVSIHSGLLFSHLP